MFLECLSNLIWWAIESPRSVFRFLTGRARTRDWVSFGWRFGSSTLSAREMAGIEAMASGLAAQHRIDQILLSKNQPLRGAKEDPWAKRRCERPS